MAEGKPGPGELEDRILPWSQVKVISGLSRTTVWRLQKTGDFPASVQVSRNRVGWWQSEILEWRRSRIPRRLPEPTTSAGVIEPRSSPRAAKTIAVQSDPGQKTLEPSLREGGRPVRKRRQSIECDTQTAFDFAR